MPAVVNGAVLGRLVEIPAYLDQTHAQNQKDVLAIDNLLTHISLIPSQNISKNIFTAGSIPQSSHFLVKHPTNNKIINLTYGRHRCNVRKYKGLNQQSLVQIQ
jgi:hypothetical protein